ncbi:hypothetical protein UT300003_31960 [Clostridium sardiniense]
MEIRIKDASLQCLENGQLELGGYINVTERQSEMLFSQKRNKWFKETMKKGVFQRAIDKAKEIPLLLEHDWNQKLASTNNGTLELTEDNIGLKFKAVIENRDIYDQVKAGLINACSFGFRALHQSIEGVNDRFEKRYVDEIELKEVSLVKNPAYVGSLVETRAMLEEEIKKIDSLTNESSKDSIATEEERAKAKEPVEDSKVAKENEDSKEKEQSKDNESDEKKVEDTEEDSEKEKAPNDDKESKGEPLKKESSENSEYSENEDEESKKKDSKKESDKSKDKQKEKRALGDVPSNDAEIVTKESINKIVEDLVQAKLQEIQQAEQEEKESNQLLNDIQEYHREVENEVQADCMKHNLQVMRLRTDYMKLCQLKRIN